MDGFGPGPKWNCWEGVYSWGLGASMDLGLKQKRAALLDSGRGEGEFDAAADGVDALGANADAIA